MKEIKDNVVTIFEAKKELGISLLKFLSLVKLRRLVAILSLSFGAYLVVPYSEVLRIKSKIITL